jgi:hypothetical protein
VEVYGDKTGMRKLLNSATVRIYAGSLVDPKFPRRFCDLLGPQEMAATTEPLTGHPPHLERLCEIRRDTQAGPPRILEYRADRCSCRLLRERGGRAAADMRTAAARPDFWSGEG